MSQLQVNRINDASGGVLAPISSVMRNRIINGQMTISQRNGTSSVTPTTFTYTLDRWYADMTQASKFSVQQDAGAVTPPAGFIDYLGVTSLAATTVGAGDFYTIGQVIEGFNTADLDFGKSTAKTITISFWVRSSLTGTFGGVINNSGGSRAYPFTYTISAANTWEQKSVTIAGDTTGTWLTNNGAGIELKFSLGVGSTFAGTAGAWGGTNRFGATGQVNMIATNGATFYITGVQLEVGTQATSFEYRQYQQELALCQRYYEIARGGQALAGTTSALSTNVSCSVEKRGTPTVALSANLYRDNTGTTTPNHASINVRGSRFIWTPSTTNTAEYHAEFTYSAEL